MSHSHLSFASVGSWNQNPHRLGELQAGLPVQLPHRHLEHAARAPGISPHRRIRGENGRALATKSRGGGGGEIGALGIFRNLALGDRFRRKKTGRFSQSVKIRPLKTNIGSHNLRSSKTIPGLRECKWPQSARPDVQWTSPKEETPRTRAHVLVQGKPF